MTNTQEFMQRVEAERCIRKIPVTRLCNEVDIMRSSYYRWIDGSADITLHNVFKLSQRLNVPINEYIEKEETPLLDDINKFRHNLLLDRPEAGTMVEELLSQGMEVEDIAIAFQTGAKRINRILLNHRSNDDTYKRKLG